MVDDRRRTRIIRCPSCGRYYRLAGAPPPAGTRLRCTKCGTVFSLGAGEGAPAAAAAPAAGPERPRLLLATDGPEFRTLIAEVFSAEGYELRPVRDGGEAWEAIRAWRPHVALLDVALPGVPAFELCDRVRGDAKLKGTGLVLIASVFQQTRYKRAPTSLYGADDYIEKHHIRDRLPDKVARLLPAGVGPVAAAPAPEPAAPPPAPAAPPVVAPPPAPPPAPAPSGPRPHDERLDARECRTLIHEEQFGARAEARQGAERLRENLRRYARIIVSDIALYNEELVARGIREGSFYQVLKKELDEGHRLYLTRVPAASAAPSEAYWSEAVREFVERRSASGAGPHGPARGGRGRA